MMTQVQADNGTFTMRWATMDDAPALDALIRLAIDTLQADVLTPEQVVASHAVMGLDRQLIADGTYLIAQRDGQIAGCGGWSRRATLYGGDHSADLRDPALLDPARDPARIRAMYTHPAFVRQGVGRRVLHGCEQAAARHGFVRAELMATMSGQPLYVAAGYQPIEPTSVNANGVVVPMVRMGKALVIED
jgi:GNAT superfamily N-acetyltransferase